MNATDVYLYISEHGAFISISLPFILFCLLWWWGTINYNYWNEKKVKNVRPIFPFLGNIKPSDFTKSFFEITQMLYDRTENEKYTGIYLFNRPALFVRDPDVIKRVMVSDFDHFASRGFQVNLDVDPLANNIINIGHPVWKPVKAKLSSAFTKKKLKNMTQEIIVITDKFVKKLESPANSMQCVNISMRYGIDVLMSVMFHVDSATLDDKSSPYFTKGSKVFDDQHFLVYSIVGFLYPGLHRFLKLTVTRRFVTKFFVSFLNNVLKSNREKEKQTDFVHGLTCLLIDSKEKSKRIEGKEVNIDESLVIANGFMYFAAGFDILGKISSFSLFELAKNQEIQNRARQEVQQVLKQYDSLTYEAICEMTYLDQIFLETNRKYPALHILFRKCGKRYQLPDGGILEAGIPVLIPVSPVHYDPKYYPDPQKFDPERFSEEKMESKDPCTFLPFGLGPRMCSGTNISPFIIKIFLIKILTKYKIKLHHTMKSELRFKPRTLMIDPKEEISIVLEDI